MRPDEDRTARLWLEYNGQYLLWPYVRSYIATITALTNVLPLTIETLRVPDPPELEKEEAASPDPEASNAQ